MGVQALANGDHLGAAGGPAALLRAVGSEGDAATAADLSAGLLAWLQVARRWTAFCLSASALAWLDAA